MANIDVKTLSDGTTRYRVQFRDRAADGKRQTISFSEQAQAQRFRALIEEHMGVLTRDAGTAAALLALAAAPTILIRPDPSWGWPGGYYVIGDDLTEDRRIPKEPTDPDRLWTVPLTPVAMPPAALEAPLHTWDEVLALYATWNAVMAAKATWLDLIRDPDPGGG